MRILRFLAFASILAVGCAMAAAEPPNQLSFEEKAAGWKLLFDGQTPQGWHAFKRASFPANGWIVEDGWLHVAPIRIEARAFVGTNAVVLAGGSVGPGARLAEQSLVARDQAIPAQPTP